jgi:predicted phage terminase large subunit-like protein
MTAYAEEMEDIALLDPELAAEILKNFPSLSPYAAVHAQAAEVSLHEFVKQAWHTLEPNNPFVDGPHIRESCRHLEAITRGDITWLMQNQPPRSMKSLLCNVFWPAWEWGPQDRPHESYLSVAHKEDLAKRDLMRCRNLIKHPWYQARWGKRFSFLKTQDAKTRYGNDRGGYRIATSKGAALGEGGSRILFDDLQNAVKAGSAYAREEDWRWYQDTFLMRDFDKLRGVRVCTGQRLNQDDIYGRMLEAEKRWCHLFIPLAFEPWNKCVTHGLNGFTGGDWRSADGEPMWLEMFGDDEKLARQNIKDLREADEYVFASQAQQHPIPTGGIIFVNSLFKRYQFLPDIGTPFLFSSWDLATKGLELGCACAGCLLAYYPDTYDYYLLDERHFRKEFPYQCEAIMDLADRFPEAMAHVIEDASNGSAAIATLQGMVKNIQPFHTAGLGNKEQKWRSSSPTVHGGHVYVPEESWAPWVTAWLGEVCSAPLGTYNDRTDAFSNGILWNQLRDPLPSEQKIRIGIPDIRKVLTNLAMNRRGIMQRTQWTGMRWAA